MHLTNRVSGELTCPCGTVVGPAMNCWHEVTYSWLWLVVFPMLCSPTSNISCQPSGSIINNVVFHFELMNKSNHGLPVWFFTSRLRLGHGEGQSLVWGCLSISRLPRLSRFSKHTKFLRIFKIFQNFQNYQNFQNFQIF